MDQDFVVFYVGTPGTSGNPTGKNLDWRAGNQSLPAGAVVLLVQDDRGIRVRLHGYPRTVELPVGVRVDENDSQALALGDAIEEMANLAAKEMGEFA